MQNDFDECKLNNLAASYTDSVHRKGTTRTKGTTLTHKEEGKKNKTQA